MISNELLFSLYFSLILTIILPLGLIIIGKLKKKIKIGYLFLGGFLFFLIRVLIVGTISTILSILPVISTIVNIQIVAIVITVFLIALSDLFCKKIIYRFIYKKSNKIDLYSLGLGQGIFEVQFTVTLSILNCYVVVHAVQNNQINYLIEQGSTLQSLEEALQYLNTINPLLFITSAIIALTIIALHVLITRMLIKDMDNNENIYGKKAFLLFVFLNIINYGFANINLYITFIASILFIILEMLIYIKIKNNDYDYFIKNKK